MDINFDEIQNSKFTDPILKKIESVLFYLAQSYASLIKNPDNTHEKIQEFDKELGDFIERYQQLYNVTSNLTELELQKIAVEFRNEIAGVKTKLDSGFFKGAPFTYNDFTPAQLAALKVKGDKFVYSDFTSAQLESLRMYNATTVGGKQATDFMQVGYYSPDLNNMKTAGTYRVESGHLNMPSGVDYGNILVLRTPGANTYSQIITDWNSTNIHWRSGSDATGWQPWRRILSDGSALTSAPLGYVSGLGVGGIVVQGSLKTDTVTLNKLTGRIVMAATALANNQAVSFLVNNSFATNKDFIGVSAYGTGYSYKVETNWITDGQFQITVTNKSGASLSEALPINFTIIKGAIS